MGDLNGAPGTGGGSGGFGPSVQGPGRYTLGYGQGFQPMPPSGEVTNRLRSGFQQQGQPGGNFPYTPGGVTDQVRAMQGMQPWGQPPSRIAPQGQQGGGFPKQ